MRWDTLSGRIFAALAILLVALLATAAILGEVEIRSFHLSEIDARLSTAADLLVGPASDALSGRRDQARFDTEIRELGRATRLRLTVIAPDGTVIADSESPLPLASHADRPEVVAARDTGRGQGERKSATTGRETRYFARRVDADGKTIGFARAAAELSEMEAAIATLRKSLVVGGLVALASGVVASFILARWLARPLERIGERAELVARDGGEMVGSVEGPIEVRQLSQSMQSMAGQLRSRIETSRRAQSEMQAILSGMTEGVVAVDTRERVLLMNDAAARLLGLDEPLEPGAALWERLRFPELESALRSALSTQGAWHGDAASPRADGRTLALSVAPVGHATGNGASGFLGVVALISDVTAIRRLEQVRIDFVANVSHELRTPLAAVMGALETLGAPDPDAQTLARFLDIGSRNAARLQAIVSDLLDLSSIEAEGDRMPLEPTRVFAPLRAAAGALAGAAEFKGVKLEVAPAPARPILVNANSQRLEQAFTNLLENAIKYTPAGGRVSARVLETEDEVHVEVTDSGIGIPAASLPRVFERFYRVDRSRSREMGGTGLGLAIVKHVVRAHGGQVEVASVEGAGSTFTITLPRLSADPA